MSRLIRQAVELFLEANLLSWDRVACLESLKSNTVFNQVALDSSSSYEEVYLAGLSLKQYNFLLTDQSYFQLSIYGKGARFAYYPNPFTNSDALLELADDPVDFDSINIADFKATAGRAPMRFDLAPDQYVPITHPYAHFHFGHGELGRFSSRRVFCPITFCLFVMRLYYVTEWSHFDIAVASKDGFKNAFDSKLSSLLLENGFIDESYFGLPESRIAHVG